MEGLTVKAEQAYVLATAAPVTSSLVDSALHVLALHGKQHVRRRYVCLSICGGVVVVADKWLVNGICGGVVVVADKCCGGINGSEDAYSVTCRQLCLCVSPGC
jgi:hypothetical protein